MWIFVTSGILYLMGIAVVLFLKPTLMFTPDGQWKEFGIGQDESRYSPFPFWLFCLAWAIVSYTLVVVLTTFVGERPSVRNSRSVNAEQNVIESVRTKINSVYNQKLDAVDLSEGTDGLPNGYYVLNKKATRLSGMPKYVFIGSSPPVS
jgi:hypothetical protein